MAGGESSSLSLLSIYESSSDSERDSGYTSEEDKKRKINHETEGAFKRRRVGESVDEEMIVDGPEYNNRLRPPIDSSCKVLDKPVSFSRKNGVCTSTPEECRKTCTIPLPNELTLEGPSHVDDSSKHQGRVRSFPHDPGNWAAIFYLPLDECTSSGSGITSYDTLQSLVSDVVRVCSRHSLHLTPATDFHISLSKTLQLRLHLIQPLAHDVRAVLASMLRFNVWLNKFSVYVNDDRSRTFLGLRVLHGHNELASVVHRLDRILTAYCLPTFYKECSLHASVAWVLGDQSALLRRLLPMLEDHFVDYFTDSDHLRCFQARHLHFKAGNRVHSLQMGPCTS